jgi:hypothetical protein
VLLWKSKGLLISITPNSRRGEAIMMMVKVAILAIMLMTLMTATMMMTNIAGVA